MYKGVIDDDFSEFMIAEKKSIEKSGLKLKFRDNYWD
jgi:hypothetical protein